MATRTSSKAPSRVIGAKAFAAISAVEGLKLAPVSRRRIERLMASGLDAEGRRAEVLRAYRATANKE